MKICLTGATGFIGTHLLERLLARGDEVQVLALPGTAEALPHHESLTVVIGGLEDLDTLAAATHGAEVVYHLAGLLNDSDPADMFRVNVEGSENLLRTCSSEARRVVFTSSVAVYRPAPWPFMWPLTEDHPQAAHGNEGLRNYGQSKIEAEARFVRFHDEHGLEYVILRPSATYGPGAPYASRVLRQAMARPWAGWARAGGWGPTAAQRSGGAGAGGMQWLHARDLAEALVQAGTVRGAANEVFNVAGAEVFTFDDVGRVMWEVLGRPSPLARRAAWPGPSGHYPLRYPLRFDISKAERLLGFTPQVTLREGLSEMVAQAGEVWSTPSGWQAPVPAPARDAMAWRRPVWRRPVSGGPAWPGAWPGPVPGGPMWPQNPAGIQGIEGGQGW